MVVIIHFITILLLQASRPEAVCLWFSHLLVYVSLHTQINFVSRLEVFKQVCCLSLVYLATNKVYYFSDLKFSEPVLILGFLNCVLTSSLSSLCSDMRTFWRGGAYLANLLIFKTHLFLYTLCFKRKPQSPRPYPFIHGIKEQSAIQYCHISHIH